MVKDNSWKADPEIIARYKQRLDAEAADRRRQFELDPPELRARVATGLKNLHHWCGAIGFGYHGPWPKPADLYTDEAYADFYAAHAPAQNRAISERSSTA